MPNLPEPIAALALEALAAANVLCAACGRAGAARRCTLCKTHYCGRACQRADWHSGAHPVVCDMMRNACAHQVADGWTAHAVAENLATLVQVSHYHSRVCRQLARCPPVGFKVVEAGAPPWGEGLPPAQHLAAIVSGGRGRPLVAAADLFAGTPVTYVPLDGLEGVPSPPVCADDVDFNNHVGVGGAALRRYHFTTAPEDSPGGSLLAYSNPLAAHRPNFLGHFLNEGVPFDPTAHGLPAYGSPFMWMLPPPHADSRWWQATAHAWALSLPKATWEALVDHWEASLRAANSFAHRESGCTVYTLRDVRRGEQLVGALLPTTILQRCALGPLEFDPVSLLPEVGRQHGLLDRVERALAAHREMGQKVALFKAELPTPTLTSKQLRARFYEHISRA